MKQKHFNEGYEKLTPRQKEVLRFFLAGETEEAIAEKIGVSDRSTVRRHLTNICRKFGIANEPGEHNRLRDELVELFAKYKPNSVSPEIFKKHLYRVMSKAEAEFPEGQVPLDSPFYVERSHLEARCYTEILQPGALIRIKAPKQMGKTSLLDRILDRAAQQGCKIVRLNLQEAEDAKFSDLDTFLRWFSAYIALKLNLPAQLDNYWNEAIYGSMVSCKTYVEYHLLRQIDSPLVLGLDEADRVFQYGDISQPFFAMLRSWYEEAKTQDIWKNLRMVVVHSTEDYGKQDINQSPFNVGLPVELAEFTPEQVQDLAQRHGLDWKNAPVQQLMAMVGGHPYLIRLALYRLAREEVAIDELLRDAPTDAGIYNAHLRRHLETLQQQPKLAAALKQVVNSPEPVKIDTMQGYKLDSMGLIKRHGDNSSPRCQLYRLYFNTRLVDDN